MPEKNYLVCTIKPWHIAQYKAYAKKLPGNWHLITDKAELTEKTIASLKPRYIFFPHWSWIVPKAIVGKTECVCFHSTDLPYGRGGSPLQNLIIRGHKTTKISALRMSEEVDGGPIYLKKPLSLEGSAQEIFERMAHIIPGMIETIVMREPTPTAQKGKAVVFKRRSEEQNILPKDGNVQQVYDHIRMLDADTYPKAFIPYGNMTLEFSEAKLHKGKITASVDIIKRNKT